MKKYIYAVAVLLMAGATTVGCSRKDDMVDGKISTDLIDAENPPVMTFKDTVYNFGDISQGEMVKYTFYFTNTGKSSLLIQDVRPACGCTVPKDWPKHPIKPGEEGKIDVTFDSAGKQGKMNKIIRVIANTRPSIKILKLVGNIAAPDIN